MHVKAVVQHLCTEGCRCASARARYHTEQYSLSTVSTTGPLGQGSILQ